MPPKVRRVEEAQKTWEERINSSSIATSSRRLRPPLLLSTIKRKKFNDEDDPGNLHELFRVQITSRQLEIEQEQQQRLQDRAEERQQR